ncbi:MAG: DUF192 domain-containing protein, partial [Gemmatimonadales bacterium]
MTGLVLAAGVVIAGGATAWMALAADDGPAEVPGHRALIPQIAADSAALVTATPTSTATATTPATATPTATATSTWTATATPTATTPATPTCHPVPPAPWTPQYHPITVSHGIESAAVTAELALTGAQRQRGLMGRASLADTEGMLFVFPGLSSGGFWMKDTPLPLDIAYINAAGQVIDIKHGVPCSLAVLSPSGQYQYVLEVAGGWFERMGMGIGAQ